MPFKYFRDCWQYRDRTKIIWIGSALLPLLWIGKTLTSFSWSGKQPVAILLFIRLAMLGDTTEHIESYIRGPRPSKPIDLDESRALIIVDTWTGVMFGNLKCTS